MMRRSILMVVLLAASCVIQAKSAVEPTPELLRKADAHAKKVSDADRFIDELNSALAMAEDGMYGKLPKGALGRLFDARDRIIALLKNHDNALELQPDQRIALYNAQEVVTSILRNNDKDRRVCRREVTTGSRLGKVECLTIGQIEERSRASRYATERLQTGFCVPGEGNPCSK